MLISADARAIPLRDGCVQMVCTSPPYWGLRNYGHPNQLGLEDTPDAYVANLVTVFREVWRVLKDDGVLFLNLGDSYATGAGGVGECPGGGKQGENWKQRGVMTSPNRLKLPGLKPKDLCGIPWMVAFALRNDGWYLRSDIIWSKPNPMPESVTDRPTKAHEYVFLLSKRERYYYDADAIAEAVSIVQPPRRFGRREYESAQSVDGHKGARAVALSLGQGTETSMGNHFGRVFGGETERNARSVWAITTQPYPDAHFATFPEALPERCIKAGSRMGDLVFDPFIGSGTVGAVAERLGRRWVGTDIAYHGLSTARTAQRGLRF